MRRALTTLLVASALLGQAPATTPAPSDLLQQAKALWTAQGDRDGALGRLEQVVASLNAEGTPQERHLLCEAYNWLAVLEDRSPSLKAKVPTRLQAILDLDPDFALDKTVTPQRLLTQYDRTRDARFVKVEAELQPPGGRVSVDGRALAELPRWIAPGRHQIRYARPGYQAAETAQEFALGAPQKISLSLTRVSSTLRFITYPVGAEVWMDGKRVGITSGKAGPEARETAERFAVSPEELSGPFVVEDLAPGRHVLELRMPCYQSRRLSIPESFTTPPADNDIDPIKLSPAKGTLTVTSAWKGGEAFLDGQSLGPLPIQQKTVCPGTYQFTVRYAAGGFSRTLEVADGQALTVEARPKPRLAYLGIEGDADYPGKARLTDQLLQLGSRLGSLAFAPPQGPETPSARLAKAKQGQEAELALWGRTVQVSGATLVELHLATLDGYEEQFLVKPLDQDPLGELIRLLDAPLPLSETGLGVQFVDLPGEAGPWVLKTDEACRKAGVATGRPVTQVNGKSVSSVAALRTALAQAAGAQATLTQDGRTLQVPLVQKGRQLPLAAASLSYVRALAELRLRVLGAQGDEAALLRLNLAQALLHFRKTERALEVLREARFQATDGIGQGTLAYVTGLCLSRLGSVYLPESIQAFQQALKYPGATLGGPDGPRIEPLAKAALFDLQPQ